MNMMILFYLIRRHNEVLPKMICLLLGKMPTGENVDYVTDLLPAECEDLTVNPNEVCD
jgi:hypothetical protein